MAGNYKNILIIFFLISSLMGCNNAKLSNNNLSIKILNKTVSYNSDTINYYLINESNKDINLFYNPEFFKREKDTIIMDTWFSPQITILNNDVTILPQTHSVDYFEKVRDSLKTIRHKRKDYQEVNITNPYKLYDETLKDYVITIKKHDSVKFSTSVNFEGESRFYDLNEQEGYILKNSKTYELKICINDNINSQIINYLKRKSIYYQETCSNKVKLIFIKTNYSDE